MFNVFFSFSIGEAGFKMLNLQEKKQKQSLSITVKITMELYHLHPVKNTNLRRWEPQQGRWTSEPLPWPGGPEAQPRPRPPGRATHWVTTVQLSA